MTLDTQEVTELTSFFDSIGIVYNAGMIFPVLEDNDNDIAFVKFMSDAGSLDTSQADQFEQHLNTNNISYERDERRFLCL